MRLLNTRFILHVSPCLEMLFLFIHVGAVFFVYFIDIFWWIKLFLIMVILVSLYRIMRLYVLLNASNSIIEFWPDQDRWCLEKRNGEQVLGFISYPIFISSYLVIINFTLDDGGRKLSLPIIKDSLSIDNFRKLKMLLRVKA